MIRTVLVVFAFVAAVAWWSSGAAGRALAEREESWGESIQAGDLVFQDLDCGERCALIRSVTNSRYSHVGVVVEHDGARNVWEALAPVGPVPLSEWVRRGINGQVAVYRPRTPLVSLRPGTKNASTAASLSPRPMSKLAVSSCLRTQWISVTTRPASRFSRAGA